MGNHRIKRWVFATDSHGDMIDPDTERAFLDFCKQWKPSIRIHGGDFMDLRALRRGASDEEKSEGVKADVERGIGFIADMRATVVLNGNHDDRLPRSVREGCGRLREYATMLHNQVEDRLQSFGVQRLPYCVRRGVYELGRARIVHGYHAGMYAAKMAAQSFLGRPTIMGHTHCFSAFDLPTSDLHSGYSIGCMCDINMEYAKAHANTLRWSNGWAYGLLFPNGEVSIYKAEKMNNRWVIPTEFASL